MGTATVHFERINARNILKICDLSDTLSDQQRKMVANNAVSIVQAHCSENAWLRAIYAGEILIGLIMLHIGSDYADGIDCPAKGQRHSYIQVFKSSYVNRVSPAAGSFADYCGSFHILEIIGEFLCSGESVAAGKHIKIDVRHPGTRDVCVAPELLGGIGFSNIEAVEMFRLVKEIAGDKLNHAGRASAVLTQIEDNGIGIS